MKKICIGSLLLFLLAENLMALDFTGLLESNIGKEVFVFLDNKTIRYGGDTVLYPLYITEVDDNILVLKSRNSEVIIYVDIDKITAVEIIDRY